MARQSPSHFFEGAPDIIRKNVLAFIAVPLPAVLPYDVIFRQRTSRRGGDAYGLDFGADGSQGQHFYLGKDDMHSYRKRMTRRRVSWAALPEETRKSILAYLSED